MHRFLSAAALIIGCSVPLAGVQQESQPAPAPPVAPSTPAPAKRPEFFSGTVSDVQTGGVTVTRKSIARDTVTRTFLMDSGTTVEGKLRVRARVTVRFIAVQEGLRAVHIIVR